VTDTNVIKLAQPGTFTDSLTEILRNGARALLTQAVETEVADFLGRYAGLKTEAGRHRVVRLTAEPWCGVVAEKRASMGGTSKVSARRFSNGHLRAGRGQAGPSRPRTITSRPLHGWRCRRKPILQ
jgi:hypothetical protein